MNQLVTEGDRVYVEFCTHCERHQWCTKHNAAKYLQYYSACRDQLVAVKPSLAVCGNVVPPGLERQFYASPENDVLVVPGKLGWPRIGAFEVYYRGKRVFSKLETGLWPQPGLVAEKIREIDEEMERNARKAEMKPKRKKGKMKRKKSLYRSPARAIRSQEDFYPRSGTARRKSSHLTSPKIRPQTAHSHKPAPPVPTHFLPKETTVQRQSSSESDGEKEDVGKFQFAEMEIDRRLRETEEQQVEVNRPVATVEEKAADLHSTPTDMIPVQTAQEDDTNTKVEIPVEPIKADIVPSFPPEVPISQPDNPHSSSSSSSSKSQSPVPVVVSNPTAEPIAPDPETQLRQQLPEARYSAEAEDYSGFEATSPVHPIREVTKSYDVTIPMGKYTNKKITYVNASDQIANFTLVSSHPTEMEVREAALTIEPGAKGALKLQFNPVYEEITKHYYLYVDRDSQPWECFEFVITFD